MLPTLPAIGLSDLRLARQQSRNVFLREPRHYPDDCPNCGGIGVLWLQISTGGPFKGIPPVNGGDSLLFDNGWYTVETKTYPCPVCNDPRERNAYLWRTCGLPQDMHRWEVGFIKDMHGKQGAYETALSILTQIPNPSGWYLFHGGYGVGKTGILASLVASSVRAGCPAVYARANDILTEIRDTYGEEARVTEGAILARYGHVRLLAIDEIEKTSQTSWALSTLMSIFDTRYTARDRVATLMATNLSPESFPPNLGYLASRLKDAEQVLLGGVELRGIPAEDIKERRDLHG